MLLTEEQAREKWCDSARKAISMGTSTILVGVNIDTNGERAGSCIGSACMKWRWQGEERGMTVCSEDDSHNHFGIIHQGEPCIREGCSGTFKFRASMRFGYCGLAGKP